MEIENGFIATKEINDSRQQCELSQDSHQQEQAEPKISSPNNHNSDIPGEVHNNNTDKQTAVTASSALSYHGMNGKNEGSFSKEISENDQTRKRCLSSELGELENIKSRLKMISSAVGKNLLKQAESKDREDIKLCAQVGLQDNEPKDASPIWASCQGADSTGSNSVGDGDSVDSRKEAVACIMMEGQGRGEKLVQSAQNEDTPIWLIGDSDENCDDMVTDIVDSDEEAMLLGNDFVIDEEKSEEREEIMEVNLLSLPERMGQSEKKDEEGESEAIETCLEGEKTHSYVANKTSRQSREVSEDVQKDEKKVDIVSLGKLERAEQCQKTENEGIFEAEKGDVIIDEELLDGEREIGQDLPSLSVKTNQFENKDELCLERQEKHAANKCSNQNGELDLSVSGSENLGPRSSCKDVEISSGVSSALKEIGQFDSNPKEVVCKENKTCLEGKETHSNFGITGSTQSGELDISGSGNKDYGAGSSCKYVEKGSYVEEAPCEFEITDSFETEGDGKQDLREPNSLETKRNVTVEITEQTTSALAMDEQVKEDDLGNDQRPSTERISIACVSRIVEKEAGISSIREEENAPDENLKDVELTLHDVEEKTSEEEIEHDIVCSRDRIEESPEEEKSGEVKIGEYATPIDHSERKSSFSEAAKDSGQEKERNDVDNAGKELENESSFMVICDDEKIRNEESTKLKDTDANDDSATGNLKQRNVEVDEEQLLSGDNKTESANDEQNILHDNGAVTEDEVEQLARNKTEEQGKIEGLAEAECVKENKDGQENESEIILEFFEEEQDNVDAADDQKETTETAKDSTNVGVIDDKTLEEEEKKRINTNAEGSSAIDLLKQHATGNSKREKNTDQGTNEQGMDDLGPVNRAPECGTIKPFDETVITEITKEITEIITEMEVDDDDASSKHEQGDMIPTESDTGMDGNAEKSTENLITHQKKNECDEISVVRGDTQIVRAEKDETIETKKDKCVTLLETNETVFSNELTKDRASEVEEGAIIDDAVAEMETSSYIVGCKADVTQGVVGDTQENVHEESSAQEVTKFGNDQADSGKIKEVHDSSEKTNATQGTIEDTEDSMLQENSVEEAREKNRPERDIRSEGHALKQGAASSVKDQEESSNVVTEEEAKEISRLKRVKLNISNAIKALSSRIKSEPIDSNEAAGTSVRKASISVSHHKQPGVKSYIDLLPEKVVIKQEPIDDYEYPTQTNDVIATDTPMDESIVKQDDCSTSSENVFDMIRSENEIVKEQEAMEIASSLFFDPPDSDSDESERGEPIVDVARYREESSSSGGGGNGGDDATNGSSTLSATSDAELDESDNNEPPSKRAKQDARGVTLMDAKADRIGSQAQDGSSGDTSETDSETSNNGPNTNTKNLTAAQRLIEKFRLQIQEKLGKRTAQPKKTPREKLMPAERMRKEGEKETELVRKKYDKGKKTKNVPKRKAETTSGKTQDKTKRAKIDQAIHQNELEIVKALQGKAATLKIPATLLQDRIKKAAKSNLNEKTGKNLKTNQPSKLNVATDARKKTVMNPSVKERPKQLRETMFSDAATISRGTESLIDQDEDKTSKRPPGSSTATKQSTTMKVSVKIMCEKGAAYVKTTPRGPVNVVEKAVQIITIRRRVPSDSDQHKNTRNLPAAQSGPSQDKGPDDSNPLSIREKNIQRLKQLIKKQEQAIQKIKIGKEKQIDLEADDVERTEITGEELGSNQDRDVIVIDEEETISKTNSVKHPEENIKCKTDAGKHEITKKTITGSTLMTVQGYNHVTARDTIPGSMKLTISGGKVTSMQPPVITKGKVTSVQPPTVTRVTPVKSLPATTTPATTISSAGGTDGLPKITGICSLAGIKQLPKTMFTTEELDKAIHFLANGNEARLPGRIFPLGPDERQDILKTLQQARTIMFKNIQNAARADESAATGDVSTGTVTATISLATTGKRITTITSIGNSIVLTPTTTSTTGERMITLVPAQQKKLPNTVLSATPAQRNIPRVKYTSLGLPYALNENEHADGTENVTDSNISQVKQLFSPKSNEVVQRLPPSVNIQYPSSNQGVALGPTAMEAHLKRQSELHLLDNLVSKQGQRVISTPGFTVGPRPRLTTLTRPGAVIANAARTIPGGMHRGSSQNGVIRREQPSINTSGLPAPGDNAEQAEPIVAEHANLNAMPVGSNIPQVQMLQPPGENPQVQIRQPVASNSTPQNIQPQVYQRVVLIQDRGSYALVPIPADANVPGSFHVPVDQRQLMNNQIQMQGMNQMSRGPPPPYGGQYQGQPNMLPPQGVRPVAVPGERAEATLPGNSPVLPSTFAQSNSPQMPRLAPIGPLAAAGNMVNELKQAASGNEAESNYSDETGNPACKTVPEDTAEVLPESADTGKKDTIIEVQGRKTNKLVIKMLDINQKRPLFNILPKPSDGTLPGLTPVSGHAQLLARLANRTQVQGSSFSDTKAFLQSALPRSVQVSNINLAKAVLKEAPLKINPQETFDTSPYWLKHAAKHRIADQHRCQITSSNNSTSGNSNSENHLPEKGISPSEEITSGKSNSENVISEKGTSSSADTTSRPSNAENAVSEKGTSSSEDITSGKNNSGDDVSEKGRSSSEEITSGKSNSEDNVSKEDLPASKENTPGESNSGKNTSEKGTSEKNSCETECSEKNSKKSCSEKGSLENIDADKTEPAKLDAKPSLAEQIFLQIKKRSPSLQSKFAMRFGTYENQFSLVNTKRPLWKFLPAAESEQFILNFGLEEVVDRLLVMPDMKIDKEADKKVIEVKLDGKEFLLNGRNVGSENNPVHLWNNRLYVDAFKFSNTLQTEMNCQKRKYSIADNDSTDDSDSEVKGDTIHGDNKNRKRARIINTIKGGDKIRKRAGTIFVEGRKFTKRRVLSQTSKDPKEDTESENEVEADRRKMWQRKKDSTWNPDNHQPESETSVEWDSDKTNREVSESDETSDSDDERTSKQHKLKTLTAQEMPKVFVKLEDVLLSKTSKLNS